MNTNMIELNMNEMELVNGGINTDPDDLLGGLMTGWGAGFSIGAAAGTVFPVVGTGAGAVIGGAVGGVTGLALKFFGG